VAQAVIIGGDPLALEDVVRVARRRAQVTLAEASRRSMEYSRRQIDRLLATGEVIYGVTTGFGKFADNVISLAQAEQLQVNLVRSHACAVGLLLPDEAVRAAMLLRANALAQGYSGVRVAVVESLCCLLNAEVHPTVPSQGSLGASGDLAPLAHIALVLIGEGEVRYRGETMSGAEGLARAGLQPVTLQAKEGLALINGTQVMTGLGALACFDGWNLARTLDAAAALTLEALQGIPAAYDSRVQTVRGQPGQIEAAAGLRRLLAGSRLTSRPGELRVQDAYSLRCVPQVHGAVRQALRHVTEVVERECNAVTDNPLLFPAAGEDDAQGPAVISGGNFHGEPVALALDYAAIALSEAGSIAERRVERLVNPYLSGLPAFLTPYGGLQSGLMLAQYTAASLASENKLLAAPASVDSIPSSANQEDHVSMGTTAARKLRSLVTNVEHICAIELLCAAQAVEFRGPERLAPATSAVYSAVRELVAPLADDRSLHQDIEALARAVHAGTFAAVADRAAGPA